MVLSARTNQRTSEAKDEAMAEVVAEPTKRLNVEIPAALHRRVKMAAVVGETTIVELVTLALEEYLDQTDLYLEIMVEQRVRKGVTDRNRLGPRDRSLAWSSRPWLRQSPNSCWDARVRIRKAGTE